MNCSERRDLLMLLAADALDGPEAAELRAHLATGCPACAGALVEAEATLGHLALALDPVEPSPAVRDNLMRRIAADSASTAQAGDSTPRAISPTPAPPPRATGGGWLRPLAAAAAAAIVTFTAVSLPMRQNQRALNDELAFQAQRIDELETAVQDASRVIQVLRSPEMLLVSLSGTENQSDARGRILWDRARHYWDLSLTGMTAAEAGKTYQLWFVTAAEEKISAGTFEVDSNGNATLLAEVPEGIGPIVLAAVTDEPAGGSTQPTGSFQVLGNVPRTRT